MGQTDRRTDGHRTVTQTPSHNNDLTCGSEQRAECEYRCRNHRFLLINYDELSLSLCLSLSLTSWSLKSSRRPRLFADGTPASAASHGRSPVDARRSPQAARSTRRSTDALGIPVDSYPRRSRRVLTVWRTDGRSVCSTRSKCSNRNRSE